MLAFFIGKVRPSSSSSRNSLVLHRREDAHKNPSAVVAAEERFAGAFGMRFAVVPHNQLSGDGGLGQQSQSRLGMTAMTQEGVGLRTWKQANPIGEGGRRAGPRAKTPLACRTACITFVTMMETCNAIWPVGSTAALAGLPAQTCGIFGPSILHPYARFF